MDNPNAPKQEIRFRLHRVERTAEEMMEQELAVGIYGLRHEGHAKPRRFYKVSGGELFPLRLVARLADDAVAVECDEAAFLEAIVRPITTLVREKFRRSARGRRQQHVTGEHTPPSGPAAQKRLAA